MKIRLLVAVLCSLVICKSAMAGDMTKKATFAGGCFWCMEPEFKSIDGVSKVVSGYTGGTVPNPTYEQVSTGDTGHFEAIEITYDPSKVSYMALLDIFWKNVDPLDDYGQFCDKGSQYRAGVFVHDDEQKVQAEISKEKVQGMFEKPIATVIRPAVEFWPAEDYHQDYYIKNKTRYKMYRYGCGRDEKLNILWNGKPKIAE